MAKGEQHNDGYYTTAALNSINRTLGTLLTEMTKIRKELERLNDNYEQEGYENE